VAIIEAKEKDRQLYTSPYWESLIANIMVGKAFWFAAQEQQSAFKSGLAWIKT